MNIKKLPFEPNAQIARYLLGLVRINEEFFAQNMKRVILIDRYISKDKITDKSEINANGFWNYLEKIGAIEYLTEADNNIAFKSLSEIENSNPLAYPIKEKVKILSIEKIRKINFDLFGQNQKTKENIFATKKLETINQKNIHTLSSSDVTVNLGKNILVINKNTGDVGLNKAKGQLNPRGDEFRILLKLATSKDYVATYENLLGDNPAKSDRRNLSFTIRNIKEALLILPRTKAKNKDIIKNMRGHGYKLEA